MPDLPDIRQPLPDEAHEALRAGLVAAIDDLAEQVQRINDAWLMLSVNVDFAQAVKLTVASGQAAIAQMQATAAALTTRIEATLINDRTALTAIDVLQGQVVDLLARVEALEPPPAEAPPEDPPAEDPPTETPAEPAP